MVQGTTKKTVKTTKYDYRCLGAGNIHSDSALHGACLDAPRLTIKSVFQAYNSVPTLC